VPFNPGRLILARRRRAMTQTRLATECDIDARNVRRYEAGDASPSEETLTAIAGALKFPIAFFFGDAPAVLPPAAASFRSMSTMTGIQAECALSAGALAVAVSDYLNQHLTLPVSDLPDLRGTEPEQAAKELRSAWGLGNKPLPNLVHLLEVHGVRVFSLVDDCKAVDAFCITHNDTPFVFLNTGKSAEHSRFDAAHELGHLVLGHARESTGERLGRDIEREAHRFAAAFLMPREDVLARAPKSINTESIVQAKRRWGVSAVALARRLYALGLVREWHYKQLCIEMSRRGYRTAEPDPGTREQSQLLKKGFELLKGQGIGRDDVARALSIELHDLECLVFGLVMVPVSGEGHGTRRGRAALTIVKGS